MAVKLNAAGRSQANSLIRQGKVNRDASWSFSGSDGNSLLGDPPNWSKYSKWFLGKDTDADSETKAAWKYPYGKAGKVYRRAVIAIKSRAAQQGADDIAAAADSLLQSIDKAGSAEGDKMEHNIKLLPRDEWIRATEAGEKDIGLVKFQTAPIVKGQLDPATGMHDIKIVISTEVVDRDRDIIFQDGWDLSSYLQNPVVLWAHSHGTPPIGKALSVSLDDRNRLVAVDRFTPREVNEFGHMIYRMVSSGFINAASVGFKVLKYEVDEERRGYNLLENELYEHSFVPVPANPQALVEASAAGIDLRPMREWASHVLDEGGEKIALWLPRHAVENVWKQAGFALGDKKHFSVDGSSMQNQVVTDLDGFELDSGDGVSISASAKLGDPEVWYNFAYSSGKSVEIGGHDNNDSEEEDIMDLKELIESLVESNKQLMSGVSDLVQKVDELVESNQELNATVKEIAEADDVSEAEIREIASKAISDSIAARSGKLPD